MLRKALCAGLALALVVGVTLAADKQSGKKAGPRNVASAASWGTWQVPETRWPPPPNWRMSEPMSTLQVLLTMLWPQAKELLCGKTFVRYLH